MHTKEQARERTWVERHLKRDLTEFQNKATNLLCSALNTGPWNIHANWKKVDWDWGGGVRFKLRQSLATYDFDHLTRLVALAHDECIRVEIDALAPHTLAIAMHQRHGRDGSMCERHPTIERAIKEWRGDLAGVVKK